MKITKHAYKRFSERTEYNPSQRNHNANQAWKNGHKIAEYSEPFYSYLLTQQIDGDRASIKIHEENIYVFDNRHKKLITVYPVPEQYIPTKQYLGVQDCPCVILVNGTFYVSEPNNDEPIVFRTIQAANNYVKNCRSLDGNDIVVIPI